MSREQRIAAFINSMDGGNSPFLESLEKKSRAGYIPVIRREMQAFLKTLLEMQRPERILEIGSAVGFSAILMAEHTDPETGILTIEQDAERFAMAEQNIRAAGMEDRIRLIRGDAAQVLKTLTDPFDSIFMDAAKGQYIRFLPDVLRLMRPGSVLLSDNVLQGGDILESHYIVERRSRTIYHRMREYLYALTHAEELQTSLLPLGDGAALSVRKREGRI